MLHFGGGKFDKSNQTTDGYYGASSTGGDGTRDMGDAYRSRKQELEERILHKKLLKAEKLKRKEDQVETFETMDESFAELAGLLQFRDKERERVEKSEKRKKGTLDADEMEMDAWDKEMKVRYDDSCNRGLSSSSCCICVIGLTLFSSPYSVSISIFHSNIYLNEKSRPQTVRKLQKKLPRKKLKNCISWKHVV